MSPDALSALSLDLVDLGDVRRALAARIAEGLEADGQQIRALPAHLPPPEARTAGLALVMDLGGTHMRAALVELGDGGPQLVAGPIDERLDLREAGGQVSREAFFDRQAALLARLAPPPGLPLGYCFSYPAAVGPSRDAVLLAWTKGIDVPGVVGTPVGAGLAEAARRAGVQVGRVTVLNDTVATLLAATLTHGGRDKGRVLGLILGTGTNIAAFIDCARAPKLAAAGLTGLMAVNLESGNFTPPHLTRWDDALDRASINPGAQRLEKAVSGYYLPYLFAELCPGLPGFDPGEGTAALTRIAAETTDAGTLARRVLDRAADLTAAALAGVIDHYVEGEAISLLAEGSTFWKTPGFAGRVEAGVAALLGPTRPVQLVRVSDANLLGAACAALVP
jgi:hexokinase